MRHPSNDDMPFNDIIMQSKANRQRRRWPVIMYHIVMVSGRGVMLTASAGLMKHKWNKWNAVCASLTFEACSGESGIGRAITVTWSSSSSSLFIKLLLCRQVYCSLGTTEIFRQSLCYMSGYLKKVFHNETTYVILLLFHYCCCCCCCCSKSRCIHRVGL